MGGRLARRITAVYVGLILLVVLVIGTMLVSTLRANGIARLEERLVAEARLAAHLAGPILSRGDAVAADDLASALSARLGARVTFFGSDGAVLRAPTRDASALEPIRPALEAVLRGSPGGPPGVAVNSGALSVAVPVVEEGRGRLLGVAHLALDLAPLERELRQAVVTAAIAGGAVALLAALAAALIARRISLPIRRLTVAARALARGENPRAGRDGATVEDEVDELTRAFDEMAARLRDTIAHLTTDRGRLGAVLSAMADGVVLLDGERVVLANRAAVRLLAIHESAAGGDELPRRLIELVPDHELLELVRGAQRAAETRDGLIRLSPTGRILRIIAAPMRDVDAASLLLVQDVTEIRRAETIRRDFAANVSHELKTPIAGLKALVETLEDGALEDTSVAREFLGRMHVEIDGLAQLVQELLDLARIESGRARMSFAEHDPAVLLRAADRLRPQADRAGVQLVVDPCPDLPLVRADGGRVEGAMINLVHNAIKFTPPGGRVLVRAERVDGSGGTLVRLLVQDTGCGIAADDMPRLWERFYKADRSRASSGTGLGLAIVKHVVQAHGGDVGAESVLGAGSTFWFTLPTAAPSRRGQGRTS